MAIDECLDKNGLSKIDCEATKRAPDDWKERERELEAQEASQ